MMLLDRNPPRLLLRWELLLVCLLVWGALISIPLLQGGIGLSWDALNHHIYLGWVAEKNRFDQDFLAASYQAYQFPYLYWPVYKLAVSGLSGAWAGTALATLHVLAVPPIWMLARTCIPGHSSFDMAMRVLAVILAFLSGVVLSLFDSTSNDLLAALPLIWAFALSFEPLRTERQGRMTAHTLTIIAGLLAGASVACKLSNGPLAITLPIVWLFAIDRSMAERAKLVFACGMATVVGYFVVYGYWGLQLWNHFGNPIYPFYDHLFVPVRQAVGWTP